MSDIFEKTLGRLGLKINLSGDTYESEQRYRLVVAIGTFILGWSFLSYSSILWIITAVKIKNYIKAFKEKT